MNTNRRQAEWTQNYANGFECWSDLTDDDLRQAAGGREQFIRFLLARYGMAKVQAERIADEFMGWVDFPSDNSNHL